MAAPPEPYVVNVPSNKGDEVVALFRRVPATQINNSNLANTSAGETWQNISNRTGVTVADLMAANPGMTVPKGKVFVPVKETKSAPYQDQSAKEGETYYQVVTGPGTIFEDGKPADLDSVNRKDGLAQTILILEATRAVPWTAPQDASYDANRYPDWFHGMTGTYESRGFHAVMGDGGVRFLPCSTDDAVLNALTTWYDGLDVDLKTLEIKRK